MKQVHLYSDWIYLTFIVQALRNTGGYTSSISNTSFGSCPLGTFGSQNHVGTFGSQNLVGTFGSQGTTSKSPPPSFPQHGSREAHDRTKGHQPWQTNLYDTNPGGIQLPEYPIPPHPRAPAVPQKMPSVDISETESGIIDPLVSKQPETNWI